MAPNGRRRGVVLPYRSTLDGFPWRLLDGMPSEGLDSIQKFVRHYTPHLRRCVRRVFFSPGGMDYGLATWQDIDDVVQCTWMALVIRDGEALRNFDPDRSPLHFYLGLYACREARNYLTNRRRLKRGGGWAEVLAEPESPTLLTAPSHEPTPERTLVQREAHTVLEQALCGRLTNKGRLFYTLLYVEELKPQEVAMVLGVSPNVVHKWQERIRRTLRDVITEPPPTV